jgi:hypothetical protein
VFYLLLGIGLFILPAAKKLKLFNLFEFESRVKEIKEDVKQFKDETRTMISIVTGIVNTVSNSSQTIINNNLSDSINKSLKEEEPAAKAHLEDALRGVDKQKQPEPNIESYLASTGNDLNLALAKLRIDLEREVRNILNSRIDAAQERLDPKFTSLGSMFPQLVKNFPKYWGMSSSFQYVVNVCNAAIHGVPVVESQLREALYMGLQILGEIKKLNESERT